MNKKQARNLYKCVRALKESPNPKAFNMDRFIDNRNIDYADNPPIPQNYDNKSEYKIAIENYLNSINENNWCATPVCVIGHFAVRSDLQKIIEINVHGMYIIDATTKKEIYYYSQKILNYFGIDYYEARKLFSVGGCNNARTIKSAITYIENFLKTKGYNPKDLQ